MSIVNVTSLRATTQARRATQKYLVFVVLISL